MSLYRVISLDGISRYTSFYEYSAYVGHIGTSHLVHCREVVLFLEVLYEPSFLKRLSSFRGSTVLKELVFMNH